MTTSLTRQQLTTEQMVRLVLEAPGTVSMAEIARRCGISRQAARMIRHGQLHPNVLPDLPRTGRGTGNRRCWDCKLAAKHRVDRERMRWARRRVGAERVEDAQPWCSLGIPESIEAEYARECPVFERMP
jgi:hypothetical protein